MYKIKRYLDCYIPITTCNLKCSYCYIAQQGLFKAELPRFQHSAEEIREALSQKRLGGTCFINLCAGGETLIARETVQIVRSLLEEGHFVAVVTNGLLTDRFQEIAEFPKDLLKRLFFKFSFHYLELKRLSAFEKYFDNVSFMKASGASFSVELTPCDEEIPFIDDIKKICMEHLGAYPHVTIARSDIDPEHRIPHLSELSFDHYIKTWETFDSALFDFKKEIFYQRRCEFCYAGLWGAVIDLGTGNMSKCYDGITIDNIFKDPKKPLRFEPVGKNCGQAHCYNGHVWLSFGCIPEIRRDTYAIVRNRICSDQSEWLQPEMKEMCSSRLWESNKPYSKTKKMLFEFKRKAKRLTKRALKKASVVFKQSK